MLNVVALYEHGINGRPHGSSYIRTLLPLDHPSLKGHVHADFNTDFRAGDILLIDRTWTPYIAPELAEQIVRQARRGGAKLVYSLDDNLMDVNAYFPFRKVFTDEQVASVRYLASRADHIITSTVPLQQRLRALNPHVSVIPNFLDERLFSQHLPAQPVRDRVVLGYMGTASHESDLLSILEPLRSLLSRYRKQVSLELVGIIDPFRKKAMFGDLPVTVRTVPAKAVEYPDFVQWMRETLHWDIGLAPLEDTPFTACKSDIKWLDYSLLGIPGLFSRAPAYCDSVADEVDGLLVDSSTGDWYRTLERMVADQVLRSRIRTQAFETVQSTRTLKHNACQWLEAFTEIRQL